jgi:hypothetical protein
MRYAPGWTGLFSADPVRLARCTFQQYEPGHFAETPRCFARREWGQNLLAEKLAEAFTFSFLVLPFHSAATVDERFFFVGFSVPVPGIQARQL